MCQKLLILYNYYIYYIHYCKFKKQFLTQNSYSQVTGGPGADFHPMKF